MHEWKLERTVSLTLCVCVYYHGHNLERKCVTITFSLGTMYCSLIWPMKQRKHKTVCSGQRLIFAFLGFLFLSIAVAEMSSMRFNALSCSSSMNFTYPSTNKLSKQRKHGNCKPIMRNKRTWSLLFFLCSSSPSLHLGCHCRHCGSLHSRVSCV